ncbi:Nif3-like dinuclear metal center hexameric protein [Kroppenstedtia eburnea]|uniref:GTP cyclohydrolase 1 type 2 homolog n=1 Tax=Kroppenstedtia eburnea TaxID=714067 RepID=A0A1N7IRY4_9BACL|nr:Nif3-like dinuclear metal center hexameric protein [Kroppenstedtia eburnea]EGK13863.1 hypothetical protein HMPREF9374_0563 [Desmospora sp. 8437]QKI82135.1 hypothetical protein GXN75_09040 [Kroppenstedtia eburnea]SIS39842.1 Putative GTP cyclohydrolase 1 type 2, NIF3 family [Kroppenstedtia eburnea]
MVLLERLEEDLSKFFRLNDFGPDPAFSRFIPAVYEKTDLDWKREFEPEFTERFNGLMIRGGVEVGKIFLAVFPTEPILERFLEEGKRGDLLFMHHPITMECGDPRGDWGRGFIPIPTPLIRSIREKGLSIYTCHHPLDVHREVGTSLAIVEALGGNVIDSFFNECGLICELDETDTDSLIQQAEEIFDIPYVDFEGQKRENIRRIAVVAGCGDKVSALKEAEKKGAQAYLSGEIHCHIDNEYGRTRYREMMAYIRETSMSLIGVSHAASEYLVKKTRIKGWLEHRYGLECVLVPQVKWWM